MYASTAPETMNATSPSGTSNGTTGFVNTIAMNVQANATISGPSRFWGRRAQAARPVAAKTPETSSWLTMEPALVPAYAASAAIAAKAITVIAAASHSHRLPGPLIQPSLHGPHRLLHECGGRL